jgi:23S rRNA pseudouridine2605 synthase
MLERLQKIIARAGIASRRHAEQLILSGQVRVNGQVVTELGSKADAAADRIEAAGKVVEVNERRVYIVLNKPPEVVATMADPEGRKTLVNCLKGLPERVYPVGRLDYNAMGLVFLTNDGDLAAEMLKDWGNLQQSYHVKIKGRLMMGDLERLGRNAGGTIRTVRQPDATRGHAENFWYEVTLQDSKKDILRRVLFAERHPVEKLKRIGLGPLTLEGLPQGRYRLLVEKEVAELRRALKIKPKPRAPYVPAQEAVARPDATVIHSQPQPPANRYFEKRRPENGTYASSPSRAGQHKHGPRPSRPPSTQDREGYPYQEAPSDSAPSNRPKWGQNRGQDRGPGKPFSPPGRPKWGGGKSSPRSGSGNRFAGPRDESRGGRPPNRSGGYGAPRSGSGSKFAGSRDESKTGRPPNRGGGYGAPRPGSGSKFAGPRDESRGGRPPNRSGPSAPRPGGGNRFAGPRGGAKPGRPGAPRRGGSGGKPFRPDRNKGPR